MSALGIDCIIVGDMNIDTVGDVTCYVKRLSKLLLDHNMTNEIDFPTRTEGNSSTSLDHVYSNLPVGMLRTAPVVSNISDHVAVRCELPCVVQNPAHRIGRCFSRANQHNFCAAIESVEWREILNPRRNAAEIVNSTINIIKNQFDICFPLRKICNYKSNDSSWITPDVKNYKIIIFEILKIAKLIPCNDNITKLISSMNICYGKLINLNKATHYDNTLRGSNNKSKAMWKIVNKERGKENAPFLDVTDVVKDSSGVPFLSKKDAVNAMNERFLNAAVACGAPRADVARARDILRAARPPPDRSMRLSPFSVDEVVRIVTTRIPAKTSIDYYGLSMKLFRTAIHSLAPILTECYNRCIIDGSYPTAMKISKVSPLYKGKGKRENIDSYRPVAIIPAAAKVFENGLSTRLVKFLATTEALSERQYAYREGRSTSSLTREVVHRVLRARETRQQVAILCCDLSKAFDVADHAVLAAKLQHYGISGASHALLTSVMKNRSQTVDACGGMVRSEPMSSTMGVAQGSSISNILFSLLLNDLPESVTAADIFMYADDVAAVVTAPGVDLLELKLNETTSQLAGWFRVNGLALNQSKTHFIHFCLSGHTTRPLTVSVEGQRLKQAETTTFLGFEIDRCLTWESHINKLCGRLGSACFALNRVAKVVSAEVVRSCYFATVHSLLQYGAELFGRAAEWERVFRLQKRAIRAIAKIPQDNSARPHFKRLGILTLPALVIYQVAVYVRENLASYGKIGSDHSYPTSRRGKLGSVPRKLVRSSKCTHVMGPTVYNKLPEHVTAAPTMPSFKSRLKRWLIEQTFYSYEEFIKFKSNL